ncbi:MAG: alpha-hydroxy-acid oxidizing protein [Actinobacteria bacterium]|jgi:isopentenyl diphosphate isomerase/L-lactate dehydrogenase-like FMN-dependent dehydrogenase|nr:alpha-hydroxy-acid oxidizing protein [Actinomycetota bacterium]NBQ60098.1 alpha-hydroxy-acid oxidizing protein [Actinomycetota bacterium]NBY82693.1 alpha-hydroxy-acid oxidizing protein [Actinomycetota bacterium]NCA25752.1 alpha-hydroxy-acid oxidizing protein [Actinomycetota bacterium]NCU78205.1 alpha-hydroxy-acid oxidizing protein [Actinomycetota bacterium]
MKRQLPRWKNIKPLLGWSFPKFKNNDRRLNSAINISDLRVLAKSRVPKAVFDYVDGGANDEIAYARSQEIYSRIEFKARVLRDVSKIDLSAEILGNTSALPIIFAPTGYTRMMHYKGEVMVAKICQENNLIYNLSTMGTTSSKEIGAQVPDVRRWFQLYLWRDREQSLKFIEEAKLAGFEGLMLTVDTAVGGIKWRDMRNGLTVPPKIGFRTFFDMALKPRWWFNLLTTAPLEFATFRNFNKPLSEIAAKVFDPAVTFEDVKWLRSVWQGKLIIKGIQTVADATELAKIGVDAIVLSNHGGRQLDRSVVPLELLPSVRAAIGVKGSGPQIYIDGAIMSGADVLAAIALGADAVLIGRAYLYGAMAAGEAGVRKVVELFRFEMETAMKLMGVKNLSELTSDFINIRS